MRDGEESDQLPEEGPSEQVPEDDGIPGARDDADEAEGGADDEGQSTGNPPQHD